MTMLCGRAIIRQALPALRHHILQQRFPVTVSRTLSTSARRLQKEEDMDELKKNPYYAKYADKIKKMEEHAPGELASRLDVLGADRKRAAAEAAAARDEQRRQAEARKAEAQAGKLKAFMKVELLEDKTAEEISQIWLDYHKEKDLIFGVIPLNEYEEMLQRSKEFGTFLYPLPREQGYEFIVQQFDGHMINFTPLIAFQAHGENAPVCLKMTHFTELRDKGIILMRGEPDTSKMSVHEAQLLALQVKMYYGVNSALKYNLVRQFNTTPAAFRHQDLIREFENYKKDITVAKEATF